VAGSAVFYRSPNDNYPKMVRGSGRRLWDDAGDSYLDLTSGFSGASVLGFGREDLTSALVEQAALLSYVHNARVTNDPQEQLAGELVAAAGHAGRVMFTSGGSEANEASLRIARQYHLARGDAGRWKAVSLTPSYHGATIGALSLTGRTALTDPYGPTLLPWPKAQYPIRYRGPFAGLDDSTLAKRAAEEVADAIERAGPESVSAVVGEPISPSAGTAVQPPGYWPLVREICDSYGVLLIADEIITGIGRTGAFRCLDHYDTTADMTNFAKGLGAGYYPIAATVVADRVTETISEANRRMPEVHTFSGSPLGCAVGRKVVEAVVAEDLVATAHRLGQELGQMLTDRLGPLPWVGDIRGKGLMWSIEYVQDRDTREPFPPSAGLAALLTKAAWGRGCIVSTNAYNDPVAEPGGGPPRGRLVGDCTVLLPALTSQPSELEQGVEVIRAAIEETLPAVAASLEG
jgi:adenosylmethionine-8-amino-7-oxononanoate aminotransferase